MTSVKKEADDTRAREAVPTLYQAAEKLESEARDLVDRGDSVSALKVLDEAAGAYDSARAAAGVEAQRAAAERARLDAEAKRAADERARLDAEAKRVAAEKREAAVAATATIEAARRNAVAAKAAEAAPKEWKEAEAKQKAANDALAAGNFDAARANAAEAAAAYDRAAAAAKAAAATPSPELKRALAAKAAMEAAKALCVKVPQPGMPHFKWAQQTEAKALAEFEKGDYVRAEKLFIDAKTFYDTAAGRR